MKVKFSYLEEQFSQIEDYIQDLRELVRSTEFTLGPYVEAFEKDFAKYLGVKHAIGTNNGTEALTLALKSLGIGQGDEVITAVNTFIATAGAIVAAGAQPVFVDCNDRFLIDPDKIEKAVTNKTKAIMPVHYTGAAADLDPIFKIAQKHRLQVVEDSCPALGAKYKGQFVGTFGRLAGFSMHPLKPLNVWGDGGIIVTNDDECARWLRLYRNHGLIDRDHVEFWGVNHRLQPIQAVVARRLLPRVTDINEKRVRVGKLLDDELRKLPEFVRVPPRPANVLDVHHLYIITVRKRDALVSHLNAKGIEAKVHYPLPLHLQKCAKALGYKKGDFPVAEQQANEVLTLPMHQYTTQEEVFYMVDQVKAFYNS